MMRESFVAVWVDLVSDFDFYTGPQGIARRTMLIATCCLPVQLCPAGAAEVPHSFILFRNCSGLIVPIDGHRG